MYSLICKHSQHVIFFFFFWRVFLLRQVVEVTAHPALLQSRAGETRQPNNLWEFHLIDE